MKPMRATAHIQNTAPGPPVAMATDTPAMFPTPSVEASAVQQAWNGEISPSPSPLSKILPNVFFMACPNLVNWKNLKRTDRYTATADVRIRSGHPHSQLEIAIMMSMINIFYLPNNFMRSIFDWLNHLSGSLSPRLPRLLLSSYIRYAASRITCLISNNSVWWKRIPLSRIVKAAGLFWTCIQKSGSFSVERDHFPKLCQKPKPQLRPDTKHFHGKLRILFSFLMIYDII